MYNIYTYEGNSTLGETYYMCIVCGVFFSTLTLFTPVTEAPNPANVTSVNVPKVQYQQINSIPMVEKTRIKLAGMLNQLPNSDEMRVLREELESLQAQLATVKDDAKAKKIIEIGLNSISKRILAEPNSDQTFRVFMKLLEAKYNQQAANGLNLNAAKKQAMGSTPFIGQGISWGWLH